MSCSLLAAPVLRHLASRRKDGERCRSMKKLNQTTAQLRDKAFVANARGELPKHIEELHQRLRASEEKVIDLDILRISAEKEREMSQNEIGRLQGQIDTLKKDCENLEAIQKAIGQTVKKLEEEKLEILEKNTQLMKSQQLERLELQARSNELHSQVDQLKGLSKQKEKLVQGLENDLLETNQRLDTLIEDKRCLCESLEAANIHSEGLQQANKKLTLENAAFSDEISNLKKGQDSFERSCREMYDEKLNLIKSEQSGETHKFEQKIDFLNSETARLRNKMDELVENHQWELSQREKQETELLSAKESELILQTLSYEQLRMQKETLEGNFCVLQDEKSKLKEEICRISDELSTFKENSDVQVKALTDEISSQKKQFSSVISEMYAKTLAYEELKSLKTSLEEQLKAFKNEHHSLNNALKRMAEDFSSSKKVHEEEKKKLTEEMAQQTDLLAKITKELSENNLALEESRYQKSMAEERASELEEDLKALQNENECLKKKINGITLDMCNNKKWHEEELHRLTEHLAQQTDLLAKTSTELSEKTLALEKSQCQSNAAEERLGSLEANHRDLKEQERLLKDEIQRMTQDTFNSNKQYQEEMSKLYEEVSQLNDLLRQSSKELSEKTMALDDCQCERTAAENKAVSLERTLHTLKEENQRLQEELKSIKDEFLSYKKQQENEMQKMSDAESKKEEELFVISTQFSEITSAFEKITLENKSAQEKLSSLRLDLSAAHSEKSHLENKLGSTLLELNDLKKQLEDDVSKLTETIKLKHGQLEEIHTQKADLEEHLSTLEFNFNLMQNENKELREQTERVNTLLEALQEEHEKKLTKLKEEKDYQEEQYTDMINEMSEKIQQLEEDKTNHSIDCQNESEDEEESWKQKYEELEKRMEPFKEVIDAFEVERKLIQDRDKYTQEQIDKLQQEAIKNMGHQNHKQKVKYVNSLKQENVTLHQKYQESQEELFRQTALVKKYKQKIELLEGGKTDAKYRARGPLKEGNR
ncbi:hyaluronan mediated motility receptor-like [Plakobranchus ocellatus]|uniref:Hyaluronan mediated motility receptor-like n=1 Tax=Plakobranchus ocellatus TaxID=259542 RepID=A0AAV3Y8Z2_9GAST|nr:hyaluronan mediated motility receptor-like [Plakobranchus ocellatus]